MIFNKRERIIIFINSQRLDLLLILLIGFFLVFFFDTFSKDLYRQSIQWLSATFIVKQTIAIGFLPLIFLLSVRLRKLQLHNQTKSRKDKKSHFMDDSEVKDVENDYFGFNIQAKKFAKSVYNLGSSKSLVYGIDAPWGTGKSTFINLCKIYWDEKLKNETIVFDFTPLKYENRDNLFEKFVNGLIIELKNHVYSPELEGLVSKYARLLKDTKATYSLFGVRFNIPFSNDSIDKAFEELKSVIESINKKIIIVVDDLDRISFSNMMEILFVIKKAFNIPNVSYVLCYDTESLNKLDQYKLDKEKVSEFLEKFINIKTSIFLDYNLLLNYFIESQKQEVQKSSDFKLINRSLDGLKEIFKSLDFHSYLPFIGDARKLKTFINTIKLLQIEETDIENADFHTGDFIHLMLIYINYPKVFRKIYNTETDGKNEFFSAKYNFGGGDGKRLYFNSDKYKEYIQGLSENEKFLLDMIFEVEQRFGKVEITKEISSTRACFNGSALGKRNLETYIKLIVTSYEPQKTESYIFYVNLRKSILNGKKIEDVFQNSDFSDKNGEELHRQLWTELVTAPPSDYSVEKAIEVINYLIQVLPNYSILELNGEGGLRRRLPYMLVKMLDRFGWVDKAGVRFLNNVENISQIAEWIFGEGIHTQNGILDKVGDASRGGLGLYDLLSFRLSCCQDRGGEVFNLSRSLINHGNARKDSLINEMREISQKVFKMFKEQYIDKGKNIFSEIEQLTFNQLTGKYSEYYHELQNDSNKEIFISKNSIINFMIYQLGNTIIDHGIGCGYYDIKGTNDNNGINEQMNRYLFDICFNPDSSSESYIYFIDYLLMNLQQYRDDGDNLEYISNLEGFKKVLKVEQLSAYWKEHGELIKQQDFGERKIYTRNYTATYRDDLEHVFKTLDTLH